MAAKTRGKQGYIGLKKMERVAEFIGRNNFVQGPRRHRSKQVSYTPIGQMIQRSER